MTIAPEQPEKNVEHIEDSHALHFKINDIPDWGSILLFGCQQMMICISGLLVVPFLVSELACAGDQTIALRVKLIAGTFVACGCATLLQTTFGLRLCILHGPSFAFLPALLAFSAQPDNKCNVPMDMTVDEAEWTGRILVIEGSLFCAVSVLLILGSTGLTGWLARAVGPVTICPLLLLLTIGTVPTIEQKMALHWISIVEFLILICVGIFLENVSVPIPYYSFKDRRIKVARARIFGQFPYLLGIGSAWLLCYLLTVTDLEPIGGEARTDRNATVTVLREAPWFQVPYPGQFGLPRFSPGLFLGFLASTLACLIESIGNYEICARVSHQRHPPSSSVNRAVICEGLGSMLAALLGVGTGVTTYSENIALMHITKVASRVTMQCAGVMLILLGLFTKCAAVLASIPDAVVGGILAMGMAMITGVALSSLQSVDLRLSRNLTIVGTAILMGCTVPSHIEKHPIHTGSADVDGALNMLLSIRMLVGGLIAFVLDNSVGGATKTQRGLPVKGDDHSDKNMEQDGYAMPATVNRLLSRYPILSRLPFLPSQRSLSTVSCSTGTQLTDVRSRSP